MIQDASGLLTKKLLLLHRIKSESFPTDFILSSMLQVKLMNLIKSFASLYMCIVKLITIQALFTYPQADLDSRSISMGFSTVFITMYLSIRNV